MITVEERDAGIDLVDHYFIDVLKAWMEREKRNLDSFIEHPTEHINYSPYIIPDFDALRARSVQLGQAAQALAVISGYKQGAEVTRAMHDIALDAMPSILFNRLFEWAVGRYEDKLKMNPESLVPISEYNGLFTFNQDKYEADLAMYKNATDGLSIVIGYARQKELEANTPPPEE